MCECLVNILSWINLSIYSDQSSSVFIDIELNMFVYLYKTNPAIVIVENSNLLNVPFPISLSCLCSIVWI